MKIDRSYLDFNHNMTGFMLKYKGQNIGGVSIIRVDKRVTEEQLLAQEPEFKRMAEEEIDKLVAGNGDPRYLKYIQQVIDKEV